MRVELPKFHPSQKKIVDDPSQFKVLACGRRFGKSFMARMVALDRAINYGEKVWLLFPAYSTSTPHWDALTRIARGAPFTKRVSVNDKSIYFDFEGKQGYIGVKSADRPDSLRGDGLHLLILDEAALMPERVWSEITRPMLADYNGSAMFISTPKGKSNWFYRVYLKGMDEDEPNWKSWAIKSTDNPFISADFIRESREDTPYHVFQQEYNAKFLDNAGGAFNGLQHVCTAGYTQPDDKTAYVIGVDWARSNDFTVFSVFEKYTGKQVDLVRFTDIDYATQLRMLKTTILKWQPVLVLCEENSMGKVLLEYVRRDLKDEGVKIKGLYMTNVVKQKIISELGVGIEKRKVQLLDPALNEHTEAQLNEMGSFEVRYTPSGLLTFSAPKGTHDDTVMATAIAYSCCRIKRKGGYGYTFHTHSNPFYTGGYNA